MSGSKGVVRGQSDLRMTSTTAIIDKFSHGIIVVQDIEAGISSFRALGFDVETGACYGNGQSGVNAYIRFGRSFIELLSMADRDAPPAPRLVGRVFQDLVQAGASGLLAYGLGARDIDAARRRFDRTGLSHYLNAQSMRHTDGTAYSWQVFILREHPWQTAWPVVSRYDEAEEARMTALVPDHPNGACRLLGAKIGVLSRDEMTDLFGNQLGLDIDTDAGLAILPDGFQLRFEVARDGPSGIDELEIGVSDLARVRHILADAAEPIGRDSILVPPDSLVGAPIRFTQVQG